MQRFINNWSTVLTVPATDEGGSQELSIDSAVGDLLPFLGDLDYLAMTLYEVDEDTGEEIRREDVRCYAYAAGVLQVDRAQEGTEAQAWPAGARIEARLTAGAMSQLLADVGRLTRYSTSSPLASLELNYQQGAYVLEPPGNSAELYIGFDYASEDAGALLIDVEIHSPESASPFVLTVPAEYQLLCELPPGSSVEATESSTHEITLPAAELYVLEFRGLETARLRITTNNDYQLLA